MLVLIFFILVTIGVIKITQINVTKHPNTTTHMYNSNHGEKTDLGVVSSSISKNPNSGITSQYSVDNGYYDFKNPSVQEISAIRYALNTVKSYPNELQALVLSAQSYTNNLYIARRVIYEIIIQKYAKSLNPYDLCAVALAYKSKGARYRPQAIEYFEQYLKTSSSQQRTQAAKYSLEACEDILLLSLSELYEREYRLEDALVTAKEALKAHHSASPGYPLRIGSILLKLDPSECVQYYTKILHDNDYAEWRCVFQEEYKKASEKEMRGYRYHPRSKRKPNEGELAREEDLKLLAMKFLQS